MKIKGKIHSFESLGAVDGPGLRFVVFMQGCPLRCLYCHNPDSWHISDARFQLTPEEVFEKIHGVLTFIEGVTISGGEPLIQADFCCELIDICHKYKLHVAIDTSGIVSLKKTKTVIEKADMLILDIKDVINDDCKTLTGAGNESCIATLDFCKKINKEVWIRQVLLPEYTMKDEKLKMLGTFLTNYSCITKVELLPYHTLGLEKREELGIENKLSKTSPPTEQDVIHAIDILKGFKKLEDIIS
ncbi:MAG: pyruvate formate lyase-activating protein [Clostridiales bacterium]|nr:pyruvate formate lyase-activating protein [Clostridiales bacterium]